MKQTISWLSHLWAGDIPLARTFWLHGVLVFLAAYALVTLLDDVTSPALAGVAFALMVAVCALDLAYAIVWSVGLWRSSSNYTGPDVWRYSACALAIGQVAKIASIAFALMNT